MGLEERRGKSYYYQKKRVNGRVVSSYIGKGQVAEQASLLAELERNQEKVKREEQIKQMAEFRELERGIDALLNEMEMIKDAHFTTNNYRKHKGQWRKARQ